MLPQTDSAAAAPEQLLNQCRSKASQYNAKETAFLKRIGGVIRRGDLTSAQLVWLTALAAREKVDFDAINGAALSVLHAICQRWLPDGVAYGREWVARNPTRADGKPGSFRINLATGKWADFAQDNARGGDPISLAAYLFHGGDQVAAAIDLKRMVGL